MENHTLDNPSDPQSIMKKLNDLLRGNMYGSTSYLFPILLLVEKHNLDKKTSPIKYEDIKSLINALDNSPEEYAQLCSQILSTTNTHGSTDKNIILTYKKSIASLSPLELQDNFNDIFEYALERSSDHGEQTIPKELAKLIAHFCPQKPNLNIYNPFVTIDGVAEELPIAANYVGQTIKHQNYLINQLKALVLGLNNTHYSSTSFWDNWLPETVEETFDFIIGCPPFGMIISQKNQSGAKNTNSDVVILEKCYETVKQSGKAVCIIPTGILFSSAKTSKDLKNKIVSGDLLETVVMMPSNIWLRTGINTAVLVLNHDKKHKEMIQFVDATDDFIKRSLRLNELNVNTVINRIESYDNNSKLIPVEDVYKNDLDLSPARYLMEEIEIEYGEELVKLADVLKIMKGVRIQSELDKKIVNIKDLSYNRLNKRQSFANAKTAKTKRGVREINESCLLVACVGGKLKQTFFEYMGEPICISGNIIAWNVNTSIVDVDYLLYELDADYVVQQVQSFLKGMVIPRISENDFRSIRIKRLPLKEQKAKVKGSREAFVDYVLKEDAAEYKINKLRNEVFEESASLKHSLLNLLGDIDPNILLIEKLATRLGISSEPILEDEEDFTLEDALKSLQDTVVSIVDLIERNQNGLDLENNKLETLDFKSFIKNYVKKIQRRDNQFQTEIYDTTDKGEIYIEANKNLIELLLSNIVKNARIHAFSDTNRSNYILTFNISLNDTNLIIDIADNGKGFPKSFDKTKFIRKYKHTGDTGGTGIGGYDINRIIEYFNGEFDLILDDKQYSTVYRLQFPIFID